jgi:RimJ/RimL family protein N-acetyltransferase
MAPSPLDVRFFTHDWTITIPSYPNPTLKIIRATPADTPTFITLMSAFPGPLPKVPSTTTASPPAEPGQKPPPITGEGLQKRYTESRTQHHAFDCFISIDDQIVGYGSVMQITPPNVKPSLANIGIMLKPEVRGKGIAKQFLKVLLRLSCEVQTDIIEAGTMKDNAPMRALAKSVGLVETEEIKTAPGGMVVAELLFKDIEREKWRDFPIVVEFKDQVVSE